MSGRGVPKARLISVRHAALRACDIRDSDTVSPRQLNLLIRVGNFLVSQLAAPKKNVTSTVPTMVPKLAPFPSAICRIIPRLHGELANLPLAGLPS